MARKLIWGILGGVVLGAALGSGWANMGAAIALCIAVGAVVAGVWHYLEGRTDAHRQG